MRRGRLTLSLGFAVVAVLAALYAHDLRSWQTTFRNDQVEYTLAASYPLKTKAPTVLPSVLSSSLLGVTYDRRWVEALPNFVRIYDGLNQLSGLGPGAYTLLGSSETQVTKATSDPDPARASQAYDLLGALYLRAAYPGQGTDPSLLEEAVSDLQDAVRLAPNNEAAKKNLELTIRVVIAKKGSGLKTPGSGASAAHKRLGSDALPPGAGY